MDEVSKKERARCDLGGRARMPAHPGHWETVRRLGLVAVCLGLAWWLQGCTAVDRPLFDDEAVLDQKIQARVGSRRTEVELPYHLSPELQQLARDRFPRSGSDRWRVDRILDFVFEQLGLEYQRLPTRDAEATYRTASGNCLSFVNLFVGLGRAARLNPFYVEVKDYQKWNVRDGMVVSHGHMVAGLYIDGKLSTFDFLPYRPKSYRDFQPLDDLTATAHYYNNLGAEALLAGDVVEAERMLTLSSELAPGFVKAKNNLSVVYRRTGRIEEAVALLESALAESPERETSLLTNLLRAYQDLGRTEEADAILAELDASDQTNPFYYVYRGKLAQAKGDLDGALRYLTEALRLDTEIPEVHVALAELYLATGEMQKVKHHLERALRLDATHEEARELARMVYGPNGEPRRGSSPRR